MTGHTYRKFDDGADRAAAARVLSHAFGGSLEDSNRWIDETKDVTRVHENGGVIEGVLSLYPMGHWFGGRSVSAWGVAGVAIDAAARGRGAGTRLMCDAVREMHDEGIALSALYPAVQPIYRRAGYERAGHLYLTDVMLESIAPVDRSLPIRRGTSDDEPALERLESERGSRNDGNVDRSEMMWKRARSPGGKETETHVVEEDGAITGYVRMRHIQVDRKRWLSLLDLTATTPGAARRLLAFLADHGSQIEKGRCFRAPTGPVQSVADSLCFEVKVGDVWMLRITHLENALTTRGYAPGMAAEIHLDVEDDLCPGNAGRWVLRVQDGTGTVERGGEGRVALHVRDLAPIYSGYQHPLVARTGRSVRGSDADLAALGAVFAGGSPWMQDAF
jgi:predicted acetyltransferase